MVDTKNEIWKETHLSPYYLVSNLGRVKSIERDVPCAVGTRHKKEKILTPTDYHGYYHVGFKVNGKHYSPLVHQLVMFAFNDIKKYPEWEIDHINGDSHDNRLENLEYVSSSENTKRAYSLGLQDKKVLSLANKSRKMTPEEIIEMKNQFLSEGRIHGAHNEDFIERYATRYNMKKGSIRNILFNRTNRFFGKDIVQTTKIIRPKYNFEDIDFSNNKSIRSKCKIISELFNIKLGTIENKYYKKKMSIEEIFNFYNGE